MKKPAFMLLVLIGLLTTGCGPYEFGGTELQPPKPVNDFILESADKSAINFSDYQGQVILLYFGYTFCPDVCPTTMAELKRVVELLGDQADRVQVVMITVDPERDTLEQMDRYVKNFNPSFVGLRTDDMDYLGDAVLDQFGIFYEYEEVEDSAAGYLVSHSSVVSMIDPDFNWRAVYGFGVEAETIVADVKHVLNE